MSLILVTGSTGKVGQAYIARFLADPRFSTFKVRALCHNRRLPESNRLEIATGDIANRDVVNHFMQDVTHVLHLATCKETPERIMDVTVKHPQSPVPVTEQSETVS